jgi:hypothetical protein
MPDSAIGCWIAELFASTRSPNILESPMRRYLHVIDANTSWVQSLAAAMPEPWTTWQYRVYSPQWLPGGARDFLKCLHPRQLGPRHFESWVVVPGWNKSPRISSVILRMILQRRVAHSVSESAILYTFPFYSHVARALSEQHPDLLQAYWAHDAFEFYKYPPGYIAKHEEAMIPICNHLFAMTPLLGQDYQQRFPGRRVELLRDAVSRDFLERSSVAVAPEMERIRELGRPVVGCIGQINQSYDWDMIEASAEAHPQAQFVFIGNLFEEGYVTTRIRSVLAKNNLHWLGRIDHERLPEYLAGFDICLNPLGPSPHNHRRDPLRIYDYLTTNAPIYSLKLDGAQHHGSHVAWFDAPGELRDGLGRMPEPLDESQLRDRHRYINESTWNSRAQHLASFLRPD